MLSKVGIIIESVKAWGDIMERKVNHQQVRWFGYLLVAFGVIKHSYFTFVIMKYHRAVNADLFGGSGVIILVGVACIIISMALKNLERDTHQLKARVELGKIS